MSAYLTFLSHPGLCFLLRGGAGTRAEISLALEYKKPVCIFQSKGDLGTLSMQFEHVPAYT